MKIDVPFDVTYTISFSGRTQIDGTVTVTPAMMVDEVKHLLEKNLAKGYIGGFTISVSRNNIAEAKKVLARSRKTNEEHK